MSFAVFDPLFKGYFIFILAVTGLSMGSFLNCVAVRTVKNEPVSKGRSHCVKCGHVLGPSDLVPLFSWLFLKGRCRYCKEKISVRYPLSELFTAAAYVLTFLKFGFTADSIIYILFVSVLLLSAAADLEACIIPDRFILAGTALRVISLIIGRQSGREWLSALAGGLSVSLPVLLIVVVMEKLLKKEAMGGGDIKLLFMTGLFFDWKINVLAVFFSCITGIVFAMIAGVREDDGGSLKIPFGPSIALGTLLAMLAGEQVIAVYLRFMHSVMTA